MRSVFAFSILSGIAWSASAAPPPVPAGVSSAASQRALIDKYCVGCHNQTAKTAGLMLDKMDLDRVPESAEVWEKVIRKLRGGMMPPQGMPRPEQTAIDALASWLENSVDRLAKTTRNPGAVAVHRLNRTEYGNAIRELFNLEINPAALLPNDDESDGFDNMASVLKVSPSFLDQYISAADQVSALAVGDPAISPQSKVYRAPATLSQLTHIEGLPLGTRGGFATVHNFPLDGEYQFNIGLHRSAIYLEGLEFQHHLVMTLDGSRVFEATLGGEQDLEAQDHGLAAATEKIMARFRNIRLKVKAGPHKLAVAFLERDFAQSDEVLQPFTREIGSSQLKPSGIQNGIPTVERLDVIGPFKPEGPGDTPSRRRIFLCHPATDSDELPCARTILTGIERRAFRRQVTDADLETSLSFYQKGRNGGNFESGIQNALTYVLASPKFLYRVESDPAGSVPGASHAITDMELASRLSFFLWSAPPDDELLNLAIEGKLRQPGMLRKQTIRMLADRKADALSDNFASQWLNVRSLDGIDPDLDEFPNFDENLRQAMKQEAELFFASIVHEDRSVLDMLTANYTFLNERLALHYGIPNIRGDQFRKVTLAEPQRWGLLGKGSVLMATSYANRTSPVLRGKWILENILGTPPPSPPPNVPALKENVAGVKAQSVRQLLEEHRANPACASCHRVMDPLGFSLENFDAVGKWRTKDHGNAIDASGQLADGTKVNGATDLREALMKRPRQFVGTFTERLLAYALGRSVAYYDMPTVREIVSHGEADNYRFSSVVLGVVESVPFQFRKTPENNGKSIVAGTGSALRESTSGQNRR
jgi:mono/diheme cytochrome c family protein